MTVIKISNSGGSGGSGGGNGSGSTIITVMTGKTITGVPMTPEFSANAPAVFKGWREFKEASMYFEVPEAPQ